MSIYRVYHGSGVEFDKFKTEFSRVQNDHYGGLLYFTDNIAIAKQYASAMAKQMKTGNKVIYTVNLDIRNLFDVKQQYSGKEVKKFFGTNPEFYARRAGILKFGVDKYQVISDIKAGLLELSGEQIFNGLSNNQQETVKARDILKKAGYDGLRYYGAKIFGTIPHTVYLPYDPNDVKIVDVSVIK